MNSYKKKMLQDKLKMAFNEVDDLINQIEFPADDTNTENYITSAKQLLNASRNYVNTVMRNFIKED